MKTPQSAIDNARNFLNEIGNYQTQVNQLGKRGKMSFTIPYGLNVLHEDAPVEFYEVYNALRILGWESDQIRDRSRQQLVSVSI